MSVFHLTALDGGHPDTTFALMVDGGPPEMGGVATLDGGTPWTLDTEPEPAPAPKPARWQFVAVAAPTATADPLELTRARGRRLTVKLSEPSDATFTLDGRTDQASLLDELASDLVVYRNGRPLFRGRVGPSQDDLDDNRHDATFTALDYRALLERRILYDDDVRSFAQEDAEQIGWRLIDATQARDGGGLNIVRYGETTGVRRDRSYEAGKSIGEAIQQLADLSDGFDWDITPDLEYRVWYPSRGFASPVVLEYGGTVAAVRRQVDTGEFANAQRVSGADGDDENPGPDPEVREAAGIGTDPRGRFDRQTGETDISEQSTLAARADWLLERRSTVRPAYTVTLRKGAWSGPQDLWVGDVALLVVRSGRLNVMEAQRVYEMSFDLPESGDEQVTVTLGRTDPLSPGRRERTVEKRLTQLERR